MNRSLKFSSLVLTALLGLLFVSARPVVHVDANSVATVAGNALKLKLMSLNVRYENDDDSGTRNWSQRVIGIVKMLHREQADVIGVQEALHGQAADLWASLSDYQFEGVGRDDGNCQGEYAGVFYRQERFEKDPADCGTFWLSDTPELVGSKTWGNQIPRITTWLRLIDRRSKRGFYVFNTHWDHKNQPSRELAARLIARRIDERRHPNDPYVLMGDFNSIQTNPGIAYLLGQPAQLAGQASFWKHGLLDPFQLLHPNQTDSRTLHFWTNQTRGNLKVDHIFTSQGAAISVAKILVGAQPMVSDHFPITAELSFPAN
jgi:endonuclease/exonuclease/phosphatase family metal-dependent hydrolase